MEVVQRYGHRREDIDLVSLLDQVKITARKRIEDAELALFQFERMLIERNVNLDRRLEDVISETPFWKPFEQHRLKEILRQFNQFSDSIYSAIDDIAALVRCRQQTREMGEAVVASAGSKNDFQNELLHAPTLELAIELLRAQLVEQKKALA